MTAGEVSPRRLPLPWCVVWQPCDYGGVPNGEPIIVARFADKGDAVTWIAITTHACDVAARCGVLGDVRVLLGRDDDEAGEGDELLTVIEAGEVDRG